MTMSIFLKIGKNAIKMILVSTLIEIKISKLKADLNKKNGQENK